MSPIKKQISPIQFKPSKELDERLERLAKKAEIPKAKLVHNIVEMIAKDLERCEKVGIFQLGVLLRNMSESLTEWAEKVKRKKVEFL